MHTAMIISKFFCNFAMVKRGITNRLRKIMKPSAKETKGTCSAFRWL